MNFTIRHLVALSATVAILVGCALAEGNIPKTFFATLGTLKWIRSTLVMAISVVLAIGIFWLWKWANRKEGSAPGVGSGIGDGTNKGVKSEYPYRSPSTAGRLRKVSVVDAWYAIFPGWSLAFYGWMIWRIWPVGYVTTVVPPNDPHYISWQEFSVTFAAMATIAVTMIVTLYVYHNRWYDAANGKWLSEDPIGFAAGDANLYRYVGNSATNATDPSGLEPPNHNDKQQGMARRRSTIYGLSGNSREVSRRLSETIEFSGSLEGALLDHAKWCGVELILFALPGDELARVSGSLGYKIIKVGKKVTVSVVATGKVLKGKAAREALINVAKCGSKTGLTRAGDIGEQIVKWGRGQGAGDVAQTIARTRGLTSDGVREMAKQGLPREWVEKQLSHYRKSFREGGGKLRNEQLLPRKELMERILELWPE